MKIELHDGHKIQAAITNGIRKNLSFDELWNSEDYGLIAAWERGREMALENPALAEEALKDILIVLPWRGGIDKPIKSKFKFGSLQYLAMWQGLRGEDLHIDLSKEVSLVCSLTDTKVTFTRNIHKFL